jgi:hypothetical protein
MDIKSLFVDVTKLPELIGKPAGEQTAILFKATLAAMFSKWGLIAFFVGVLLMALLYFSGVPMPYAVLGYALAGGAWGHLMTKGIQEKVRKLRR